MRTSENSKQAKFAEFLFQKLFDKLLEGSSKVCFGGTEGSEMAPLAPV